MFTLTPKITKCAARQILDSRGMATIEVEISAGEFEVITAIASVPSLEKIVADGGVVGAIENIEKIIAPKILKMDVDADAVDRSLFTLDMTHDKTKIGATAMIGVSMAMTRLEAKAKNIPLWKLISEKIGTLPGKPLLYMNIFSGGAHADFCLPFQEYMIAAGGEGSPDSLSASYKKSKALFEKVREKLNGEHVEYYMADDGGFAYHADTFEKPFEILSECTAGEKHVSVSINAAASELYKNEKYDILGMKLGRGELLLSYQSLIEKFNVKSIEDPFEKTDFQGYERAMKFFKGSALMVGNGLTATNPALIEEYGKKALVNGVVLKPNQIGTMTEVYDCIRIARRYGWKIIVSQCFGETPDTFISDLAVGAGADGIKAGAYTQRERVAKYERLIEIEKEMAQ